MCWNIEETSCHLISTAKYWCKRTRTKLKIDKGNRPVYSKDIIPEKKVFEYWEMILLLRAIMILQTCVAPSNFVLFLLKLPGSAIHLQNYVS